MTHVTMLEDLYRYNRWAMQRILAMCETLTDMQLDEPREIGFGSLRNTLFHILAAEEIWLERWEAQPWRPFETDAKGITVAAIADRLSQVESRRCHLLDEHRSSNWARMVVYKNAKGEEFQNQLGDLAIHVANHGIHHRAQALYLLKQHGQIVPGGLDYLFFRLAMPFVKQEPEAVTGLRAFGLEIESGQSTAVNWCPEFTRKYFAYGDWANNRLLMLLASLADNVLDRDYGMGLGTIRKTALHIFDAERWWFQNWAVGTTMYERSAESTSVTQLESCWREFIPPRNQFLKSLTSESAQRVVTVKFGGPLLRFPIVESLIQLGGHGTHHRAQLLNMLRRAGVAVPPVDFVVWLRENGR